jgi:GMP synthase (glutamine-hydrolysing)
VVKSESVWVIDFGGQYNQLIPRRVREAGVYAELVAWHKLSERLEVERPIAMILTGSPESVYNENAPVLPAETFELGIPILGICYGAQLLAHQLGGKVELADIAEFGKIDLTITETDVDTSSQNASQSTRSKLFKGIDTETVCFMTHNDSITRLPAGYTITSQTENCPIASFENAEAGIYGVQFHPEVHHNVFGAQMFRNFLYEIVGARENWSMHDFCAKAIDEIRAKVGDKKVLCALSGGVDSSVAAVLCSKAIGENLICVFVDHGLLRKNEGDEVMNGYLASFNLNVRRVNARDRFLSRLAGVTDPETKRKIIGEEFINVFDEEVMRLKGEVGEIDYLLQGTIYPDIVESGKSESATIKSHHNVGGLPEKMKLSLLEPLNLLFKDEVRSLGEELGIPHEFVQRQPFPGPGLAIRCIGDITEAKLHIIRESDAILREEVRLAGLEGDIWQYFTVLTGIQTVGVKGDFRSYDFTVAIRAVTSVDAMTSDWARIPYDVLAKISSRIVGEVGGVNRVVYDVTSKPPATIEWE